MQAKYGLWLALGTTGALIALGAALVPRWQAGNQQQAIAVWKQKIAALDEPSAAALVNSLRTQDSLAIETLASALTDRRPLVSAAAQEAVGNLVTNWKQLSARQSVPRLTALADALADRYARLMPARQQFVRQIAQSRLLASLEDADFPADELVAQCERILMAPEPQLPDLDPDGQPPAYPLANESSPPMVDPQIASRPAITAPGTLPGRDVEQEPAPVTVAPVLSSPAADEPVASPDSDDPRPQQPRQFIRPRVPPIPPRVEP